jgi:CheY-like chemotaxis protein
MLALDERRVLIVDDETIIADTAALIFAKKGFASRAVYSAEQALELMPSWTPHLAVVDIKLPGMSGIDLAIRMKAEYPDCKLVLFSGFIDATQLLRDAEADGHQFKVLAKPVAPLELLGLGKDLPEPAFGKN